MVVHYGGLPCRMEEILKICKKYRLKLIEDSAETLGSKFKNKFTGSFGLGCFSFFPTFTLAISYSFNAHSYLSIRTLLLY